MKKILAGFFLVLVSMVFLQMGCNLAATPTQTGNPFIPTSNTGLLNTTVASAGNPWGIAADSAGNIYYSSNNGYVVKIDTSGTPTTVITGLGNSRAVAVDTDGTIYASARYSGRIMKLAPGGSPTVLNTSGDVRGRISGLAVRDGKVYYSLTYYNQVRYVPTSGGSPVQIPSGPGFSRPKDLAFDGAGNLYIANSSSGDILKYDGTSTTLFASLNNTWGMAVDDAGNVYASEKNNGNIQKITPAGVVSSAPIYNYSTPRALFYINNSLLVADSGNGTIERLSSTVWQ